MSTATCPSTHNPGEWPYAARCVLASEPPHSEHRDREGRSWIQADSAAVLTIEVDGESAALHGTTKGDEAQRAAIRRPWVWSRSRNAWVLPRSLRPETRALHVRGVKAALEVAGFVVEVQDSGERLSAAERREAREERLEIRADRHEAVAVRAAGERDAALEAKRTLMDGIPFGQPILIGHHSERRARKDAARIHTLMGKAIDADTEAADRARKAENLRRALERGTPLVTLRNRIDRLEADVRRYKRNGQEELLADAEEELELDRAELADREAKGAKVWGPTDFKPGDRVQYWGGLREVVRVNAKTLSVRTQYSWLDKLKYQDVRGRISAEE